MNFAKFIKGGIALTAAQRSYIGWFTKYDNTVFDGVKREMNRSIAPPNSNFIGCISIDKDEDGELNITETKALLEHFTGHELCIEDG